VITTTKINRGTSTMTIVHVDGQDVGFITKARDTRTDLHPYKAYVGIGEGATFVAPFYTDLQIAKMRPADPRDLDTLRHSGHGGALRLILRYAGVR